MKFKNISWLPAVLIMIIIFSFSAKPAEESAQSSQVIVEFVFNNYEKIKGQQFSEEERYVIYDLIHHMVRKSAHFIEYGALAAAVDLHLWVKRYKGFRLIFFSILISAIYAASDELHQLFVPGRSGELMDVLLDTAGATVGAFVFYTILSFYENYKKRKGVYNL